MFQPLLPRIGSQFRVSPQRLILRASDGVHGRVPKHLFRICSVSTEFQTEQKRKFWQNETIYPILALISTSLILGLNLARSR